DGANRRRGIEQVSQQRLIRCRVPGAAGAAKRDQIRSLQVQVARLFEERAVLQIGARPAPLDVVDAELIQLARDPELVVQREVDALPLRAVPQRRVIEVYHLSGSPAPAEGCA